eukprot:gene9618-1729_t
MRHDVEEWVHHWITFAVPDPHANVVSGFLDYGAFQLMGTNIEPKMQEIDRIEQKLVDVLQCSQGIVSGQEYAGQHTLQLLKEVQASMQAVANGLPDPNPLNDPRDPMQSWQRDHEMQQEALLALQAQLTASLAAEAGTPVVATTDED